MHTPPVEITFSHAELYAYGMPEDRVARMAARRAFVEMKTCFMNAAQDIPGYAGTLLQRKVRSTSEVIELWRLRGAIFAALPHDQGRCDMHRQELSQLLDVAFPEGGGNTAFIPL